MTPWLVLLTHHPMYCTALQEGWHDSPQPPWCTNKTQNAKMKQMGFDPSYTGDCSFNTLLLRNGCQGGPSAPIAGYTLDGDACQRGEAAGSYALEPLLEAYQVDLVLSGHTHDWEASWPVLNATLLAKSYIDPKGPVHVVNGAAGGKHGDGFGRKWDFTRVRNTSVGSSYTHVRAHNATHMTVEQHDGSSGVTMDTFTIVQTVGRGRGVQQPSAPSSPAADDIIRRSSGGPR